MENNPHIYDIQVRFWYNWDWQRLSLGENNHQ